MRCKSLAVTTPSSVITRESVSHLLVMLQWPPWIASPPPASLEVNVNTSSSQIKRAKRFDDTTRELTRVQRTLSCTVIIYEPLRPSTHTHDRTHKAKSSPETAAKVSFVTSTTSEATVAEMASARVVKSAVYFMISTT